MKFIPHTNSSGNSTSVFDMSRKRWNIESYYLHRIWLYVPEGIRWHVVFSLHAYLSVCLSVCDSVATKFYHIFWTIRHGDFLLATKPILDKNFYVLHLYVLHFDSAPTKIMVNLGKAKIVIPVFVFTNVICRDRQAYQLMYYSVLICKTAMGLFDRTEWNWALHHGSRVRVLDV